MRHPIEPEWLLRLARGTAGQGAGRGQQRTANLRRATSDAYYALFHAIALAVANATLPNASAAEQHACSRYADFTRLGTLAHVRQAEQAVAAIRANGTDDDFRALYGLITLQTTTRGG